MQRYMYVETRYGRLTVMRSSWYTCGQRTAGMTSYFSVRRVHAVFTVMFVDMACTSINISFPFPVPNRKRRPETCYIRPEHALQEAINLKLPQTDRGFEYAYGRALTAFG